LGEELYVDDPDEFDVFFRLMNIKKLMKAERLTMVIYIHMFICNDFVQCIV